MPIISANFNFFYKGHQKEKRFFLKVESLQEIKLGRNIKLCVCVCFFYCYNEISGMDQDKLSVLKRNPQDELTLRMCLIGRRGT